MGWTGLILVSAVFLALYDLAKKASVRDNAVLPVLLCSSTCGLIAFTLALAAAGRLAVVAAADGVTLALAAAKAVIVSTSWIFTFCGLRTLPITIATPIRASSPAFVFLIAFFLYGEVPSWGQALGMLLVFGGYWAFSWAGRHEGIDFFRNRAVWFALAGMCFSTVSSLFDKFVFQVVAPQKEAVQFYFQVGLVVVYGLLLVGRTALKMRHDRFEWRWTIPFVGTLLAVADWFFFASIAHPGVPISVCSLMRRFSVVLTFVLGAKFFHETNLRRKAVALVVILIGIILLSVGGDVLK